MTAVSAEEAREVITQYPARNLLDTRVRSLAETVLQQADLIGAALAIHRDAGRGVAISFGGTARMMEHTCSECLAGEDGVLVEWPCPTARALGAVL